MVYSMSKPKKKRARVSKKRQVNTYARMWHASYVLLYKGQADERGSTWQFMASLTFTAFTLEAYLNHLGAKIFQCWDDVESLSPQKKLNLVCEHLGVKPDYSCPPYQTVKHLFKFRNEIAHGKSVTIELKEQIRCVDDKLEEFMHETLPTSWERYCKERNAVAARKDVEVIIRELHERAAIADDPVFFQGVRSSSASVIHEN